ncbi:MULTISPECIES: SCO5918 family protein [unclassified Streptomyces]|uniref:SCO5918 family protein n=1 Tax=unclassified Streptomyces TaxID=2593676 RepID=UPI00225808AB|nr:SCO5918 family protein [Streptomyces sp. NBC_01214]MCX4804235.1 SCO5918 family protein [Streptomyces sp. NBC_01214]
MRVVIARFPFDLTKSGVLESMKGVKPEPVDGESVIIGRRHYPVKQVGQVITRQDRRDFTAAEVVRAMTLLGFTCRGLPQDPAAQAHTGAHTRTGAATSGLTAFQRASAMLGEPAPVSVSA